MNDDILIDVSVVAKILGISRQTVYRHFDEGNLKKVKTGARKGYKVWRSEVYRLKEQRGY